jgi:hypothetical protein
MKLIKNYDHQLIDFNFLNSNEWDVIQLNKKVDATAMFNWFTEVEKQYSNSKFNFTKDLKFLKTHDNVLITDAAGYKFDKTKNDLSGISSYTLSWLVQTENPLPPPWAASLDIFPELNQFHNEQGKLVVDIDYKLYQYLDHYMFSEWLSISNWLKDFIFNPRISIHEPSYIIKPHTDDYVARLHIPLTTDDSLFCWGENLEREYSFYPGNIYLINSKCTHGTKNLGNTIRANLMADLDPSKILTLLSLW